MKRNGSVAFKPMACRQHLRTDGPSESQHSQGCSQHLADKALLSRSIRIAQKSFLPKFSHCAKRNSSATPRLHDKRNPFGKRNPFKPKAN